MRNGLERCTEQHRLEAATELMAELETFSFDGLVQLSEDLGAGQVIRGSWNGCVISYRRGAAGSTRRDRRGRARNAFTVLWDNGRITDEEVRDAVASELDRRVRRSDRRPANRRTAQGAA